MHAYKASCSSARYNWYIHSYRECSKGWEFLRRNMHARACRNASPLPRKSQHICKSAFMDDVIRECYPGTLAIHTSPSSTVWMSRHASREGLSPPLYTPHPITDCLQSCMLQPGPIDATSLPPIAGSAFAQLYPLMTQIGRKRQVFLEMPAWWQVSTTALTSL